MFDTVFGIYKPVKVKPVKVKPVSTPQTLFSATNSCRDARCPNYRADLRALQKPSSKVNNFASLLQSRDPLRRRAPRANQQPCSAASPLPSPADGLLDQLSWQKRGYEIIRKTREKGGTKERKKEEKKKKRASAHRDCGFLVPLCSRPGRSHTNVDSSYPSRRGQAGFMNYLETIFGELGISQYLGAFIDQGFDSWDTILDITESDLDALGVKLGHRRKLQRRIANYRGIAPDASLTSPARTSIEDARHDANRAEVSRADAKVEPVVTKRKYRRHPKPDENAPERPPSAYVLFSNKMREDLKGQNLTFTEIAKLVGENWQNLGRTEKAPFEKQANEAKEKYNRDLAKYKKTSECKKYNEYLRDFRKRQAAQTQERDAAKRLKTDAESTRGSSTSGGSIGTGGMTNGTASGSESQHGSEPPPSRQQRLGSIASLSTGTSHLDDSLASPMLGAHEESGYGRRRGLSSPHAHDPSMHASNLRTGWADSHCLPRDAPMGAVSWLDPRGTPNISQSPEASGLGLHARQNSHADRLSRGTGSGSSRSASISQTPSLIHAQSLHGSTSSSSSSQPPRTPSDASLPIHALLSSRPEQPVSYAPAPSPPMLNGQVSQVPLSLHPVQQHGRMLGNFHGSPQFNINKSGSRDNAGAMPVLSHETGPPAPIPPCNGEHGLDGISALLKAREIVDRRP